MYLSGISRQALAVAGSTIALQPSAVATLQAASRTGASLFVISVNWSQDMIKAALKDVPPFALVSPDLEFSAGGGVSTGRLAKGGISGALDKEKVMKETGAGLGGASVYVGDSVTDVLAMLHSDVGIVVGKSRSLRKVCASISASPFSVL